MAGIGSYDPRSQAHVSLTYKTLQNQLSATRQHDMREIYQTRRMAGGEQMAKTAERTYRTSTAVGKDPAASDKPHFSRQTTQLETAVNPPFLSKNGRWDQSGVPHLMAETQGQPLTTTGSLDATTASPQAPKAISAVYSYADVSPLLTTEFVHDSAPSEVSWAPTINKRGTIGVFSPSGPDAPTQVGAMCDSLRAPPATTRPRGAPIGDPVTRKASAESFWHRTGQASHLQCRDVGRCGPGSELSTRATAGSANCRLVAGKWRYLPRPVEGTQLFTDYYGRNGKEHVNYYGRQYHYLPQ